MENNFYSVLLTLVSNNKDKFLGLLRRNGVLVNSKISADELTNVIISAMTKSESFKKEVVLFMSVLMSEKQDSGFANFGGNAFNVWRPESDTIFGTNTQTPTTTTSTTSTTTATPSKEFEQTTFGKITGSVFSLFDKYMQSEELKTRQKEATASQNIKASEVKLAELDKTPKTNTGLIVGLTIGGLALVGALVFFITKKK